MIEPLAGVALCLSCEPRLAALVAKPLLPVMRELPSLHPESVGCARSRRTSSAGSRARAARPTSCSGRSATSPTASRARATRRPSSIFAATIMFLTCDASVAWERRHLERLVRVCSPALRNRAQLYVVVALMRLGAARARRRSARSARSSGCARSSRPRARAATARRPSCSRRARARCGCSWPARNRARAALARVHERLVALLDDDALAARRVFFYRQCVNVLWQLALVPEVSELMVPLSVPAKLARLVRWGSGASIGAGADLTELQGCAMWLLLTLVLGSPMHHARAQRAFGAHFLVELCVHAQPPRSVGAARARAVRAAEALRALLGRAPGRRRPRARRARRDDPERGRGPAG